MGVRLVALALAGSAQASEEPAAQGILDPHRSTARRSLLVMLHNAEASGDAAGAARLNAELAHEAYRRCLRATRAWENLRDAETGLLPRSVTRPYWSGDNAGADCWPYLFLTYDQLDPERSSIWMDVFAADRRLCGVLPQTVHFQPTRFETGTEYEQLFGGAEYVKDGLLAIAERKGRGPWFARMLEIARTLIERAPQATTRGPIVGNDTEINGDMLILLTRLYWATRDPAFLAMAQRTADLYLLDIMPTQGDLPPLYWDFARNELARRRHADLVKFRDHGNETIFGLAELYFLERHLGLPQAAVHQAPLQAMLDRILVVGRTDNGLWCDAVRVSDGEANPRTIDTWGYLLNAFQTFDLAEGTHRYAEAIAQVMSAAARLKSFAWEHHRPDGYADALEGMMYLLPWFDRPDGRAWLDDEMENLFSFQQASGLVEAHYLDGNFIRTALLYGDYKTQGVRAEPWREDVRVGAARDAQTGGLTVYVSAAEPWSGELRFDTPRHQTVWGMPFNYPRINAPPEWFVVPAGDRFVLTASTGSAPCRVTGAELAAGWPVTLAAGASVVLQVQAVSPVP